MKQFFADLLFTYARHTEGLYELMKRLERVDAAGKLTEEEGQKLLIVTKFRAESCDALLLPASKKSCEEIMAVLNKDACPYARDVRPLLLELNKRTEAELRAHMYFYVSKERSIFYQKPLEGWETTGTAFPSAWYDIEEAGKCLALQRSTAAVFHLMRVIGAGVTALGKSLNEPFGRFA